METVIRKWGKSPALRLHGAVMQAAGFALGQRVTILAEKGRHVVEALTTDEYKLDDLLAQMTPSNLHGEAGFGAPRGREAPPSQTSAFNALVGEADSRLSEDGPIVQMLRGALPHAMAIYAFGSQVEGTRGAGSDLDLAVLVAGYTAPLQLWDLSHHLAGIAGRPVDLLDLRAASTVMQYQVLMHGKRLWKQGLDANLFECFVMGEKLSLDEARAGVLADIAKSGRVYGG